MDSRIIRLAGALLAVTLLAACGNGGSAPSPTPTAGAATSAAVSASPSPTVPATPAVSASPSPSWPVKAPDDPTWTAEQVAAVRAVDAFREVLDELSRDPASADFGRLAAVAVDPQYTHVVNATLERLSLDKQVLGSSIPVTRAVGEIALVDGHQEIVVRQCDEDSPDSVVIEKGVERPVEGSPRVQHDYVVQWVEEVQAWRVALLTKTSDTC